MKFLFYLKSLTFAFLMILSLSEVIWRRSRGISHLCCRRFGWQAVIVPMDSLVSRRCVFYLLFVSLFKLFITTVDDFFYHCRNIFLLWSKVFSFALLTLRRHLDLMFQPVAFSPSNHRLIVFCRGTIVVCESTIVAVDQTICVDVLVISFSDHEFMTIGSV